MKIIHITPDLKWSKIFILPIAEFQADIGNEVIISAPSADNVNSSYENIRFANLGDKLKNPRLHIVGIFKLIKAIRKESIDNVFLHTSLDSCLPIIFVRIFTQAKVIYVNHGVTYDGYSGLFGLVFRMVEFLNIASSHRTISITKSMSALLDRVNLLNKDIETLSPGTIAGIKFKFHNYESLIKARSMRSSLSDSSKINLIYVARIEKRKGIYELVEALSNSKLSNFKLSVVGNGRYNSTNENKEITNIIFKGYVENITDFYLDSELLIVPSYHEGFGQVYLEAASLGVIPVCSNILGPTDFIEHGYNGFTVIPRNVESITALLEEIAAGVYDLDEIRKNAFNSAKVFESNLVLKNNAKVFNKWL